MIQIILSRYNFGILLDKKNIIQLFLLILKKLKDNDSFDIEYRARVNGVIKWHKITFSSIVSGTEILVGTVELNNEILYEHVKENILEDYYGIYIIDLDNNIVSSVKTTKSFTREIHGECYSKSFINFINGLKEEDVKFFGITIVPEKEMLLILAEKSKEKDILDAIKNLPCLQSKGSGITYCIDVNDFAPLGTNQK